jgi:hypothetical protein
LVYQCGRRLVFFATSEAVSVLTFLEGQSFPVDTDQQSVETIAQRLKAVVKRLEIWEKPIEPDVMDDAISAVRDLIVAFQQVHAPGSALQFDQTIQIRVDPTAYKRMVVLGYAREQADNTRLELAAYAPHAQSLARRYLQRRREVVYQLGVLLKAVNEAVSSTDVPKRVQPDYLRIVPAGAWHGQEREEVGL